MKLVVKVVYILFSIVLLLYLLLPNLQFPEPHSDFLQSEEPGDRETPLRRAYFTNLAREEVLMHYERQFTASSFMSIPLPFYRLNYPPEEAQTIIRDQTRSTYLEEIVHPLRESVFVNGFEPSVKKDAIVIEGQDFKQKITVRFIPSELAVRVIVGLSIIYLIYLSYVSWLAFIKRLKERGK